MKPVEMFAAAASEAGHPPHNVSGTTALWDARLPVEVAEKAAEVMGATFHLRNARKAKAEGLRYVQVHTPCQCGAGPEYSVVGSP